MERIDKYGAIGDEFELDPASRYRTWVPDAEGGMVIEALRGWAPKDSERFWSKVDRSGGPDKCWVWKDRLDKKGYGRMTFKGVPRLAHRVAFRMAIGRHASNFVCHKCDVPRCCNPNHLYDGTAADNTRDMMKRGRHKFAVGEKANGAKLTELLVLEIRSRYTPRIITYKMLSAEYGVSYNSIEGIISRKYWKHI